MLIKKVIINNYRGFSKFEVNLSKLTLIIGENDSGKSNFFSALTLPLSGNDLGFNRKKLKISDINSKSIFALYKAVIDGKKDKELSSLVPIVSVYIELGDPNGEYEEALLQKWITPDSGGDIFGIKYEFRPKSDSDLLESVKELLKGRSNVDDAKWFTFPLEHYDYQITSTNNGKPISFNDLKRLVVNHIGAERDDFSDDSTMKANGILSRMLSSTLKDNEKSAIYAAYIDFFETIEKTDTFKKIINLDPGFENFSDHIDNLECIPNLPNLKNILSNITLQSGKEFLYQRGLGDRNLIYIILLFEFYKLEKKYFNLCCIEEPEAHLGVNNLRLATDFIYKSTKKSKKSDENSLLQTLVTSHNPTVINKLDISNVLVFTGEKPVSLRDVTKTLLDYLRKRPNFDILKLLFTEKVILVEGTTVVVK